MYSPEASSVFFFFLIFWAPFKGFFYCTWDITRVHSLEDELPCSFYMHQSKDQILVVVVLMFVMCEVIITKCNVIYLKIVWKTPMPSVLMSMFRVVSLLLWRRRTRTHGLLKQQRVEGLSLDIHLLEFPVCQVSLRRDVIRRAVCMRACAYVCMCASGLEGLHVLDSVTVASAIPNPEEPNIY